MTNHERAKEIKTYNKQVRKLIGEFMKASDVATADMKLKEATELSSKVAILKQEMKENGFIAKLKNKMGLH